MFSTPAPYSYGYRVEEGVGVENLLRHSLVVYSGTLYSYSRSRQGCQSRQHFLLQHPLVIYSSTLYSFKAEEDEGARVDNIFYSGTLSGHLLRHLE